MVEVKEAIWGTGSLCQKYLNKYTSNVSYFIDPNGGGDFEGKSLILPSEIPEKNINKVVICSSFYQQIIPVCLQAGILAENLYIVIPSSIEKVSFSKLTQFEDGTYYYLPWQQEKHNISRLLNNDIVFPDVYHELIKSVGYTFIASVDGEFAEFGTCSGYSASLIAHAINYYQNNLGQHEKMHGTSQRRLNLFDSFEGFPQANSAVDKASPHVASGAWGAGTAKGLNAKQLRALCSLFLNTEQINIYPGWYKDTLATIEQDKRFAFVHLDCDLYESTFDVLFHLFTHGHLSQGAVLMFDNWFCNKASPDFAEQKAWSDICQIFDIQYTNIGMYACVGNKIIIHHYQKRA